MLLKHMCLFTEYTGEGAAETRISDDWASGETNARSHSRLQVRESLVFGGVRSGGELPPRDGDLLELHYQFCNEREGESPRRVSGFGGFHCTSDSQVSVVHMVCFHA